MSSATNPKTGMAMPAWWQQWWRRQSPFQQDRFATFVPLFAVLLFLAAIVAAISYFQLEEAERDRETVAREVDFAQLQLRERLLQRTSQLQGVASDLATGKIGKFEFDFQSEILMSQFPELRQLAWLNAQGEVLTGQDDPTGQSPPDRSEAPARLSALQMQAQAEARQTLKPAFVVGAGSTEGKSVLLLALPVVQRSVFRGVVLAELSLQELLLQSAPQNTLARYRVALTDSQGTLLAGQALVTRSGPLSALPWSQRLPTQVVSVSPVGDALRLQGQGYRTSQDGTGRALFWILGALSLLTVWMLLANWRHTRRRLQTQQALLAETNFRRAMENSMLTGMRTLDMEGRISYVNPAFCSMTGWTEQDLIGLKPPFPYWPEKDRQVLWSRLEDELNGISTPGGYEVSVRRKDGSLFDARMYVSPLIAPEGKQTGWMTSMTDITEPRRVREELTASYERFNTVLDSLDVAISVAPLGSSELLFANKMYRTWFGQRGEGHRRLIDMASVSQLPPAPDNQTDAVDDLAGLPTDSLIDASSGNNEIFLSELGKWLEVRTRYLTWVDGRLAQMVIATDITVRRQAEEQAALQAERAQTASRLITMGEMASSVAHELNQPLTAINNYCSGMLSRLQRQQMDPAELVVALEKTARQAQRAGQIIQRIRAFVKRSEPNLTRADIGQMVANATELAEIELRRHLVRLSTYLAARLPHVLVDPILIEQVLINLIKNAGEAIVHAERPPQQRLVELRVAPRQVEGHDVVEFSVQDTGRGIPPERLERIYEAFYSTKAEGMGIGLKLCRSIVEAHHGRLGARNLYNGAEIVGCEFSFWIPVADAGVAPAGAPEAAVKKD
jgi:PAS domain S-box-containing protein